jgi:hypothetical protein
MCPTRKTRGQRGASYLSYGDQGARASQLRTKLGQGDRIVFYSGLKDVHDNPRLVYAIVGIFVVDDIVLATSVPESARNANAHSRRILAEGAQDIVVRGNQQLSGRLERCLPFGGMAESRLPGAARPSRSVGRLVGEGWIFATQRQAPRIS